MNRDRQPCQAAREGCNKVYISYRRSAWGVPRAIQEGLRSRGYETFLDVDDITDPGPFLDSISAQIKGSSDMIVVLGPGSLDRYFTSTPSDASCATSPVSGPDRDWVVRELQMAQVLKPNTVPVLIGDYAPPEKAADYPDEVTWLLSLQGVRLSHRDWPTNMERLCGMLCAKPTMSATDPGVSHPRAAVPVTDHAPSEPMHGTAVSGMTHPGHRENRRSRLRYPAVAALAFLAGMAIGMILSTRTPQPSPEPPPPKPDDELAGPDETSAQPAVPSNELVVLHAVLREPAPTLRDRSNAHAGQTVHLSRGESMRLFVEVPAPGSYRVKVRYSNDQASDTPPDRLAVEASGSRATLLLQSTGQHGDGWNRFDTAFSGDALRLPAGVQELVFTAEECDDYGFEIDPGGVRLHGRGG